MIVLHANFFFPSCWLRTGASIVVIFSGKVPYCWKNHASVSWQSDDSFSRESPIHFLIVYHWFIKKIRQFWLGIFIGWERYLSFTICLKFRDCRATLVDWILVTRWNSSSERPNPENNVTTFSEFLFVPGISQWDEPKNVYHAFTSREEFPGICGKW